MDISYLFLRKSFKSIILVILITVNDEIRPKQNVVKIVLCYFLLLLLLLLRLLHDKEVSRIKIYYT